MKVKISDQTHFTVRGMQSSLGKITEEQVSMLAHKVKVGRNVLDYCSPEEPIRVLRVIQRHSKTQLRIQGSS